MVWTTYSDATASTMAKTMADTMRGATTSSPTGMTVSWSVVAEKNLVRLTVSLSPHPDEPLTMDELVYSEPDPDQVDLLFPPGERR